MRAVMECTWGQGEGAEGYILDLRNNPGGLVRAGLEVARLWMPGSPAVFNVQGRDGRNGSAVMQVFWTLQSHDGCSDPNAQYSHLIQKHTLANKIRLAISAGCICVTHT